MDAELVALAAGGASALVGAMVTDAWAQAKEQIVELWRRHRPVQAEAVEGELDVSQGELSARSAADELLRARIEGRWQGRLERLLEESSEAAADLRQATDLMVRLASESGSRPVVQNVRAGRDAYTAARDLNVNVKRHDAGGGS
ncbi:hypothetical protein [Streptomyces sporangiiformans]|uniref:Uncharacterized protein n=1 Tax=Streptomyces sporangiiformans TaxID=2315329 RepID=A0A505DD65_9ACTN|nr:hypothetical protein [Streptomyces sporangiiformans]TPQ20640.1 hypothetical protein FGD71_019640 [Streptomyces sporangiiformans]